VKNILLFLSAATLLSCQTRQQQFFTSCPEIDLVKKMNAAYVSGDWQAMRSGYADTAKVYDNTWRDAKPLTAGDFLAGLQAAVGDYSEYSIAGDAVYEMIVTDDGQKWVHNWFLWKGVHKNGTEVRMPIHLSLMIVGDKVVTQVNMYNVLPAYLATQPTSVADASMKP
jgi:hypothetical protein